MYASFEVVCDLDSYGIAHERHLSQGADETAFSGNKKVEEKGSRDTFSASQLPMSFIAFCKPPQGTTKHVEFLPVGKFSMGITEKRVYR